MMTMNQVLFFFFPFLAGCFLLFFFRFAAGGTINSFFKIPFYLVYQSWLLLVLLIGWVLGWFR